MANVENLADDIQRMNIQEGDCFFIHEYEGDDEGDRESRFLEAVKKTLEEDGFKLTLSRWKPTPGEPECKVLEKILTLDHAKLILAFPEKYLCEEKLVATIDKILKRGLHFITVIMYSDKFLELPAELREFDMRRVEVDRKWMEADDAEMDKIALTASDLHPFIRDEPETVDLAFLNSGIGLASSYHFGYLQMILMPDKKVSGFEDRIRKSEWRKNHPEILDKNISKKMIIVFPQDCREPKEMSTDPKIKPNDRITFYENKVPVLRAGIDRKYDFDFRQIRSKNGEESFYGVVYFFNIVQALTEMRDDPNKDFCNLSEETMKKEGKYCFEKLRLFLKHTSPKIPEETYELIEHNPEKMPENALADKIFDCLKRGPTLADPPKDATKAGERETSDTKARDRKTNVLCSIESLSSQKMPEDVKAFIQSDEIKRDECIPGMAEIDYYTKLIEKSSRLFMVLTDEFVESECFEFVFYSVLNQVFEKNDRRFLVVLDCLQNMMGHPKALELRLFFSYISVKDCNWEDKVKKELRGDKLPVTSDLQFLNMGTGFAMSWYYRYLKFRMPVIVDLFRNCEFLMEQFQAGRMSHKTFILQPHSCLVPESVTNADSKIQKIENKDIKMPKIMKATRNYTPTLYKITDENGTEYYAFLEFNTQADTMHRMCDRGLLTNSVMLTEWERFFNKLKMLICHKKEPMQLRERLTTIEYDDENMKAPGELSKLVMRYVKDEIKKENGNLPKSIETGATIHKWEQ
ncbi:uncharacterized protein LOC135493862 isoform X2 [Lineus longissimus]|uniref:uncharacterized protein LOC135493862 isoform X2 n=1 Tax=Lineus longissimus TaxID=88925 RepID=UPI00315CC8D5